MNVLIVHGGVENLTTRPVYRALYQALRSGYKKLDRGLVPAVEAAVSALEKSPHFNAGFGSVLNFDGEVEMDAAVMDGRTGRFGAVAAIKGVASPVAVARQVMEKTPHAILAGPGATRFARELGFPGADLISGVQLNSWRAAREGAVQGSLSNFSRFTGLAGESRPSGVAGHDTVGCVVFSDGALAAASSTGGSFLKMPGRVGDTPVPGAGIYACRWGAAVCTGLGEVFIETGGARNAMDLLAAGNSPQETAEMVIRSLAGSKAAVGGMVVLDAAGRFGAAHNSFSLPVAVMAGGKIIKDFQPLKVETK